MASRCCCLVLVAAWLALLLLAVGAHARQPDSQPAVLVTQIQGAITPVIAAQVGDAVRAADQQDYAALLIELDTPGGLVSSMRSIVEDILSADVPVIVYVSPPGAHAGSAGAFITLAAHVAAMAPATNIGAATPVGLQGSDLDTKIVNDTAAFIRSIAERRGHNADVAADMVLTGRSVPASEALALDVVDVVAGSRDELLDMVAGREVILGNNARLRLNTAGASVVDFEVSFARRLLQALANPELVFVFLAAGALLIVYELAVPGGAIAGTIGVILIALAFVSLAVLEVSIAGLLLLAVAAGLFVAELFAPGIGVLAGAGAIALVFAGLLLFQQPGGLGIDVRLVVVIAILAGVGSALAGRLAWRLRKKPPFRGSGGTLIGATGTVRQADAGSVQVFVSGALWKARGTTATLAVGDRVRVIGREGLQLLVEPEGAQQEGIRQ